jgi:hypothetical protein
MYDLTNSTAGLLSISQNDYGTPTNSVLFEVPATDGISFGFNKDNDSISTFRSTARSVLKKKKDISSNKTIPTAASTPTNSVSFAPFLYGQKPDETSVSKMSDTASKVATLETRFEHMETQFNSSLARLEMILSSFHTNSQAAIQNNSQGRISTPVYLLANHPPPDSAGGDTVSEAAGHGS